MPDYTLSNKAVADLENIYLYSRKTFGEAKADAYFSSLSDCLDILTENPRLGHRAAHILPGLFCHQHAHHLVFYLIEPNGIFIVRLLHRAMEPARHLIDDEKP
jgi:toxin ParE1/3/4